MCTIMNGYARNSQYIYSHRQHILVEALTCYDRGCSFEPSDRQGCSSFSI